MYLQTSDLLTAARVSECCPSFAPVRCNVSLLPCSWMASKDVLRCMRDGAHMMTHMPSRLVEHGCWVDES